jgi:hypothetical protein
VGSTTYLEEIEALESKIEEINWQKAGADIGFQRAWLLDDADSRKKREIFRLKNRLPALAKRIEFEEAINSPHQFLVVMGQTGSGKSTQLVQYLADMPAFTGQSVSPFYCQTDLWSVSQSSRSSFEKNSADIELLTLLFHS